MPIRTRLIATFLLATILPIIVFTAFVNNGARSYFRNHSYGSLRDAAQAASEALYTVINEHEQALQDIAAEPAITRLLKEPPAPERQAAATRLLNQILEQQLPFIRMAGVVDTEGRVLVEATILPGHRQSFNPETVKLALRSGQALLWLDNNPNTSRLILLSPILNNSTGAVDGAVIACFDPELVGDLLRHYLHFTGENGFGLIWDTQQHILADTRGRYPPGTELAAALRDSERLPEIGSPEFDRACFLTLVDRDLPILGAVEVLPGYRWVVMYAQPLFSIDTPVGGGVKMMWNLALLLALAFFIVSIWLSQVVVRPISSLTKAANRIAAGDLSQRAQISGNDEIGQLGQAFNQMTSQLEDMLSGLEERNEELSQLNERLRRIVATTMRLAGPADLRRLCTIFLEELAVHLGTSGGSLYLVEGGQLKLVHTLDPGHAPVVVPYPPRPGSPFAQALQEARPLLLNDFSSDQVRASGWAGYSANETLVFPLLDKDNQPVSFIALHNKKSGRFTPQDREICAVFASFGSERLRLAQARDDLAASESRYRRLVETAQEGIITVNDQEVITFANNSIARLLGYRPSELTGLSLEALVDSVNWHKIHTGTDQRRRGISSVYEVVMRTKDGRERTMQVAASPLLDKHGGYEGALGVLTDITEYKRTHIELANQSAYLQSVFSALTDMVCVISPDLTITEANTRFRQEFGMEPYHKGLLDYAALLEPMLSASAQISPLDLVQETFATGGRHSSEILLQSPAGERILETDTAPLLDSAGRVSGVVQVLRDVTQQRRLETQLRQAHKMEAIGRLASGIAHDFNNLLAAITGCAEIALNECEASCTAADELREIVQATQRGREIVRQILAFSRRQEQERKPVALRTVVSEVLSLMRSSLPPSIEIRQEFNAPHDTVLADAGQLHQVVMNLCTNAVQAMAESGGRLTAKVGLVVAGAELVVRHPQLRPGAYISLEIQDTGCGIPAAHLDRIFEPFFTTKGGQGTGLGLAVAHSNVLSHGGAIEAASKVGEGAQFRILLPHTPAPPAEAAPAPLASRGHERVLFVDDEQLIVRTTQRLLANLGYQVTALAESRAALALLEEDPQAFDILVTDQTMPGLTGIELASAALALRPGLPVILCTGYSESVPPERARQLGISEYVMKPYSGEELGALIRRLLDNPA
jgi:two-component system, cell cycle sensor histidine kinase and response regulator CckA